MSAPLSNLSFKKITGVFLIATMLFSVAGCQPKTQEKKQYGGVLRFGSHTDLLPLDPLHVYETLSVHLLDLVFNRLTRLNSDGEMEPDLAQSWEISDDGKTYTLHLRDEVCFHNKAPFSARDVLYSYHLYISPKTKSPYASIFKNVENVTAPDDKTVIFQLKESYAPFLFELKNFYIVPAGAIPNETEEEFNKFGNHPIGTGPFQFFKWEQNNKLVLRFYSLYHEGRPYLDKIEVTSFGSVLRVWVALMREEIDLAVLMNREDFEVVKKDSTFKAFSVPSGHYYYVLAYNHKNSLLADRRLRLAIAYAINRKEIIDRALGGYGTECVGPFLPDSWAADPEIKPIPYDPQKAIALLKELGWKDENGDGILEKDGKDLELEMIYHGIYEVRTKIAYLIRQYLQEIGIKIIVRKLENISEVELDPIVYGKFDIELRTLQSHTEPSLALVNWDSKYGILPHLYHFQIPQLDNLINQAEHRASRLERQLFLSKAQRLIYNEQPFTFLFFQHEFYAVRKELTGVEPFFNSYTPYHTIKDWAQEPPRGKRMEVEMSEAGYY